MLDGTRLLHSSTDFVCHFVEFFLIDEHAPTEYLICILDCLCYAFFLTKLPNQLDVDMMKCLVLPRNSLRQDVVNEPIQISDGFLLLLLGLLLDRFVVSR